VASNCGSALTVLTKKSCQNMCAVDSLEYRSLLGIAEQRDDAQHGENRRPGLACGLADRGGPLSWSQQSVPHRAQSGDDNGTEHDREDFPVCLRPAEHHEH
jgi:hypothetical protein